MGIVHILVSGNVQGVGYRAFVLRQARELKLLGKVRNLADGRVEVLVVGTLSTTKELCRRLQRGPPSSFVTAVLAKEVAGDTSIEGFSLEQDGVNPWYGS